jgi:chromosome segregation ATPase
MTFAADDRDAFATAAASAAASADADAAAAAATVTAVEAQLAKSLKRAAELERQLVAANAAAATASEDLSAQAARLERALEDKATALEETNQWNKRGGGWFARLNADVTADAKVKRCRLNR